MRIVLLGDSITDMLRSRTSTDAFEPFGYGMGYALFVAGELYGKNPDKYEIITKGDGGNRSVDLYARIKADVWNLKPDVLSILIGVNDVWHSLLSNNGVEIDRYEKVYRAIIEDTRRFLPDVKIILCEPFFLDGAATADSEEFPNCRETFRQLYDYAKVVKRLAEEYGLFFLPLQKTLDEKAAKSGAHSVLYDGVHPAPAGAKIIADEWLKLFKEKIDK